MKSEREPLGSFYQRVGDATRFGIDWTRWLARRWQARQQVAYGDIVRSTRRSSVQFRCITPGVTGSTEPRWPSGMCVQLLDGNAIWETETLDDTSLAATLASATWSTSSPAIATSNPLVFDTRIALATVSTAAAIAGTDYDAVCTVIATDGRQRAAKIRLKVR